jgi:hypothetical protein
MADENGTRTPWWHSWSFWGPAIIAFGYFMNYGFKVPFSDKRVTAAASPAISPRAIEDAIDTQLQHELQTRFADNKQQLFSAFHPVGTAKSVVVHDVAITGWKHSQVTGQIDDILGFSARFTIYWEGPIVKDGFTKVSATWDNESQRWLPGQVLATNGMTNQQAANLFVEIAGAAFAQALRSRGI